MPERSKRKVYVLKREGKEKVMVTAYIDKELYDQLLTVAPRFYGCNRGAISYAIEEALRQWLAPRVHTQVHTNPSDKIRTRFRAVMERVKELLGLPYAPKEVPSKALEIAIAQACGTDPRTIRKYMSLFERVGLIKRLSHNLIEVVGA